MGHNSTNADAWSGEKRADPGKSSRKTGSGASALKKKNNLNGDNSIVEQAYRLVQEYPQFQT